MKTGEVKKKNNKKQHFLCIKAYWSGYIHVLYITFLVTILNTISLILVLFIAGFIWAEIKEMWDGGFTEYVHDWWNLMDFAMNSLYLATISLKMVAYFKASSSDPKYEI